VNESGGEEQGTHGALVGSYLDGLRREIGRCMPTGGIRFTASV
jgi:hypothetical protein